MADMLHAGDFVPHIHHRFQVATLEDYFLELDSLTDLSNAQLEQFSLNFVGVPTPWLPQGLYKLIHPQMGEIELFLVPNGPDAAGMRYQAAFSRFIK